MKAWAGVELEGALGLFLGGPPGTGKTHLAVSALLALCAEGYFGNFVTTQELLLECKDSFRNDCGLNNILERYSEPPVLLIDDLGAENPTDFARETVGILVDRAYRNGQQLIVTSNWELGGALADRVGARTVDRLVEVCQAVKVMGSSYRQSIAAERAGQGADKALRVDR